MATDVTTMNDLPDAILCNVVSVISDTRTRNRLALVCRKFRSLERSTRSSLALRGNARDLHLIPMCFGAVTHLDLSLLSPWGHALLSPSAPPLFDPCLLAHRLRLAFPSVTSLTVYARSASTLRVLAPLWPGLLHAKLVRWHQRPQSPPGAEFVPLMEQCRSLSSLDLSNFYHWTEDLPPVLEAYPIVARSLSKLDLLTASFSEGFKDYEIKAITKACPNLKQLLMACVFGPRYNGSVGDEVLLAISTNCPKLSVLHLVDTSSLANSRGDPNDEGFTAEDARIGRAALVDFLSGLPLVEELVLDVCKNVRDSGFALEVLGSKCLSLKKLKLGQFHGLCLAMESRLDGLALCHNLESLTIKNSADLNDMGLIEIARGCSRLNRFHVHGCKIITVKGIRTLACLLRRTLVDVGISCCKNLDATQSLKALEPIRDRVRRLHIDCIWDDNQELEVKSVPIFDLTEVDGGNGLIGDAYLMDLLDGEKNEPRSKKCKYYDDGDCSYAQSANSYGYGNGNGYGYGNEFWPNSWDSLQYLSLWIEVGEVLTPLPMAGLEDCPNLEEIRIKIEGHCRGRNKPAARAFGLSCLTLYPLLSRMQLDCSDTIGFALTAPSGEMDLSLWERFFLAEISSLSLEELDYWPPQDRDVNQRSLSLPGAGLLGECNILRKLFIHGTVHEHFMRFLLEIRNLRDVQLRGDYYPAPENDMSTEMRVDSCSRFEDALRWRSFLD